jgi:energy-coupling factor transporter ATP-binding protein EcfA2
MANSDRGSQWRKWDLHVHSPKSIIQDYGGDTDAVWDEFVQTIAALPLEVKVIGINDYLFCDGYERLLSRRAEIPNIELIIPNIEFRLNTFSGTVDNTKRHNFHVLFDPSVDVRDIREQLLGSLSSGYKIQDGTEWQQTPTVRSLEQLGQQIKAAAPADNTVHSKSDLKVGFDNITYRKEDILKLLEKDCFKGKILTAIGYSEWNESRWDQSAAEKRTLVNDSNFCLTSLDDPEKIAANRKDLADNNLNSLVLHSSDAHRLDRIGQTLLWIKADPTFEGLRQVLYEQEERVKIQERNPADPKPARVVIDKATYKDSSGTVKEVLLNSDLNSIIGVRGSGKSTLLKNIANVVDPVQFVERDKKIPYPLQDVSITWGDGQTNGGSEESPKSVFYIPQGYLSALSYDDGDLTKERDDFLTELLRKNARFARAIDSFNVFVAENDLKIQSGIQDLTAASRNLKESSDQLKKLGSLKEISAEIERKNAEMQKYKGTDLSEEELTRYAKAKKDLDDNTKALDVLTQDKQILIALNSQDVSVFVSENDLGPLSPTRRELIRDGLRKKGREALAELVAVMLGEIESQITRRTTAAALHEKTIGELKDKVAKNQAVTDLSQELLELENTKTSISQLTEKRDKAREDYERAMTLLVATNGEFQLRQAAIYGSIELEGEFKFVNISISTKYDTEQLKDFVDHNINTRDSTVKLDPDIETLFSQSPVEPTPEVIKQIITCFMEGKLKIKTAAGDVASVLGQLLKNRYVIDYPNSVKSSEGEVYFKDMTGGQKAITFLELIFSLSDEKYPILIDQPEDDLDVSGVANDLVSFVMKEKAQRQIVIVSHNATLVVCSDSEEIITSTMRRHGAGQYDFYYATGSIENPARRDEIVQILEGGDAALKKRMQKLRIV